MAKMYYTEKEAAEKLSIEPAQLADLVREGKLKVYADGTNKMYKASEVNQLAGIDTSGESDIQLAPADTGTHEAPALSDTSQASGTDLKGGTGAGQKAPGKGDTVISSEGISIFDDEDLEIETADPMAKTQIAPSLEDQIGLEGVSGGSGLLDLTRESDDTSLGEVLDHIDVEGETPSAASVAESVTVAEPAEPAYVEVPAGPIRMDAGGWSLTGLVFGGVLVMLVLAAVALATMTGGFPSYIAGMAGNLGIVAGVFCAVLVVGALLGYFLGKGSSAGQTPGSAGQ